MPPILERLETRSLPSAVWPASAPVFGAGDNAAPALTQRMERRLRHIRQNLGAIAATQTQTAGTSTGAPTPPAVTTTAASSSGAALPGSVQQSTSEQPSSAPQLPGSVQASSSTANGGSTSQLPVLPAYTALAPSSNPPLPGAIIPFTPPFSTSAPAAGTPVIAAANLSAGPNQNITITGSNLAGATFTVFGQTNSANAEVFQAVVQDSTPAGAILTIGSSEPVNSMYFLWPKNSNGYGAPIALNQTQANWLSVSSAADGQTVSIYGQNLSNGHATPQSFVYIQPSTGAGEWAAVTAVNPYQVDFTVPAGLANGTYQIWINNGLGGNYGWSGPLSLTVNTQAVWATQTQQGWFNVDNYGATGNGVTDDGLAIEAAVNGARFYEYLNPTAPLATIYFPAGTYAIGNEQINLPGDIRFVGASAATTTLLFQGNLSTLNSETRNGDYALGWDDNGASTEEFDSLTFQYAGPSSSGELIRQRDSSGILFNDDTIITGPVTAIDWLGSDDMTLENSTVIGQFVYLGSATHASVTGDTFDMADDADVAIFDLAGHDISITGNTVQDYATSGLDPLGAADPNGYGQGRFLENCYSSGDLYNEYVAGNTTIALANPVNSNYGEQINDEGSTSYAYGLALPATSDTVTLPASALASGETLTAGLSVAITNGTGVGQMRILNSFTTNSDGSVTLTMTAPWNVVPDATSRIEVGTTDYNAVYYENTFQDAIGPDGAAPEGYPSGLGASTGLNLQGYGIIADGNTTGDLNQGVRISTLGPMYMPNDFIEVINNQIDNSLQEGIAVEPSLPAGDNDPNDIGVVVQGNNIIWNDPAEWNAAIQLNSYVNGFGGPSFANALNTQAPVGIAVGSGVAESGQYPVDWQINQAAAAVNSWRPDMTTATLSIIEQNTVTNTSVALGAFVDPNVLVYDNTFNAGTQAGAGSAAVALGAPYSTISNVTTGPALLVVGNTYLNYANSYEIATSLGSDYGGATVRLRITLPVL